MKHALKVLALGAAFAVSATMAFGATLTLNSFSSADSGGAVVDSIPTTLMTAITFTGDYSQTVYEGGTNSECATCLTFVYTFNTVTSTAGDGPDHISMGLLTGVNWSTLNPVVGYVTGTGSMAPASADDNVPTAVDFNYSTNIAAGSSTDTLVIETNATAAAASLGTLTADDDSPGVALVFAPATLTPEPSSLALLGTGLLGAAGIARRRIFRR